MENSCSQRPRGRPTCDSLWGLPWRNFSACAVSWRRGAVSKCEHSQHRISSACFWRGGWTLEFSLRNFCSWNGEDYSRHTGQIIVNLRPGQVWAKEGLILSHCLLKIASSTLCFLPLLYTVLRITASFLQARQVAFPPPFEWSSMGSLPASGSSPGTGATELVAHICEGSSLWSKQPWLSGLPGVPALLQETDGCIRQCRSCFQES